MVRVGSALLVPLIFAACATPTAAPVPDAGNDAASPSLDAEALDAPTRDAATLDSGFVSAAHPAWPTVPDQGGPILAHPQLVVVTYAGFAFASDVEAYASWIVGSRWLTTVGAEYGVGAGAVVANVRLTETAPATLSETELGAHLGELIASGDLPTPSMGLSSALYVVYLPRTTRVTDAGGGGTTAVSCADFLGDHRAATSGSGSTFAFAVIPDCIETDVGLTELEGMLEAMSHELVEAATDPFPDHPAWAFPATSSSEWIAAGGEIGDLCVGARTTEDGHEVQRIWSNAAALAGLDPCVPGAPSAPFFDVSPSVNGVRMVSPGEVVDVTLTGWSTAPTSPWTTEAYAYGDFDTAPTLSAHTFTNGSVATLTLHVPTSATSGATSTTSVYSYMGAFDGIYSFWPVVVRVR